MQHIYQVLDCSSAVPIGDANQPESLLKSKQTELNCFSFPEATSGHLISQVFTKTSTFPIYTSPEYLNYIQSVSNHLHAAIRNIVWNWWDDSSLSSLIPLDPKIERILRRLDTEGIVWRTGAWRPDFLIEDASEGAPKIKICEINARFGFNGFFVTQGVAKYFENDDKLLRPAFSYFNDTFLGCFDSAHPIHILKGREVGYDIHHLPNELAEFTETSFIDISGLRIVKTGSGNRLVYSRNGQEEEVFQLVLELHQDEILSLPEDLLWEISLRTRINDMRTIMLVHDKRMLGIVQQRAEILVAQNIMSADAASLLKTSIAETYIPGTPEYKNALQSQENQGQWLFKPAGSGKGAGIVFQKDVTEKEWKDLISTTTIPHALQRAVNKKVFELVLRDNDSIRTVFWDMVGTFYNVDGNFKGFGPWRTSPEQICALSRGGSWLLGVCDRSCLPFSQNPACITHPSLGAMKLQGNDQYMHLQSTENFDSAYQSNESDSEEDLSQSSNEKMSFPPKPIIACSSADGASPGHVARVHSALEEQGLALVRLDFEDPNSDYLVTLVRDGLHPMYGHGLPVDHSQTKGWLWDVKPIHGKVHTSQDPLARSETMNDFPWHTDCSFEPSPPRHFALHVLQADRYGGGALSVLQTKDVVGALSPTTVDVLSRAEFAFTVPDEFAKGVSTLVGSLLDMSDNEPKLRYRRDIITPLTRRAETALNELDRLLDGCSLQRVLKAEDLPNGMVIILDNARWLHARNNVNDPDRHLRRVRWNAQAFPAAACQ
ncbi:hypothetical protein AA313_de0200379 [Arthrobotrys entomopaga]|nr:hypothetical protein AA313_de0200379 [Arthrobotrys entomopaga]